MKLEDWKIDNSAGRPILTYKNCSVIEAEDAEFVMRAVKVALSEPTVWMRPTNLDALKAGNNGAYNFQVSNVKFGRWIVPLYQVKP